MDCIASLIGDPTFAEHLIFSPERHYVDQDMTIQLYHDMHTGKWWWETQVSCSPLLLTIFQHHDIVI